MILYNLTDNIEILTTQIPSFRLLRAFIIFKAFKIFKGISFFDVIEYVIKQSFQSFLFIVVIIFVFLIVFSGIGFQIFGDLLKETDFTLSGKKFTSFFESIMTVFDIMTLDNYFNIFYASWNKTENFYLIFFFLAVIFVANMFLLNLFITILLNGFEKLYEKEEERNIHDTVHSFTNDDMESLRESSFNLSSQSNQFTIPTEMSSKKNQSKQIEDNKPVTKKTVSVGVEDIYEKIEEEISLFIFTKDNRIRKICYAIVNNKYFKFLINSTILFSIMYMALLTFEPSIDEGNIGFVIKITINFILIIESTALIINYGLIMKSQSYMRNIFNIIDLIVILIFFLDVLSLAPKSLNVKKKDIKSLFLKILRFFI